MTSMKQGTGSDPFADEEPEEEEQTEADDDPATDPKPETQPSTGGNSADDSESEFPYVVRRQRVKDERSNEHVAFLRDEYSELEAEILEGVAEELGMQQKDISVIDVREALVELGGRHNAELAEILDDWGYEHLR